jgi:hypothetical protein
MLGGRHYGRLAGFHESPSKDRCSLRKSAAIKSYLNAHNADPKPFVWTKTADEVPAKVAGFCERISTSRHELERRTGNS